MLVREVADEHAAVMALIENIQREDLNPLEEAHGVRRLLDEFGLTHEQAAQAIGRSRSATSNLLRLLNLAAPVQTMLLAGDVDMGHARALLAVDAATQIQLANQIIARRLSVREAEKLVAKTAGGRVGIGAAQEGQWRVARSDAPGGSLVRSSGHARRAQGRRQDKGQIVIDFHGWEHLNSCLNARACPEWSMPDALPVVAVLATGGTIAGAQADATSAGYKAGSFSVDDLLAAVPQLAGIARIRAEQVANVGSQNMTHDAARAGARVDACARTHPWPASSHHGTDTLEETAYFLSLVRHDKPVVLVGAMRPATALGAEGPANR